MKNRIVVPPPGSPEAIEMGCLCPSLDNGGGAGWLKVDKDGTEHRLFWISDDCLLHRNSSRVTLTGNLTFERGGEEVLDEIFRLAAEGGGDEAPLPDVVTMS